MENQEQAGEPLFTEIQRPSAAVVRIVSLLMMAFFVAAFWLVPVSHWLTLPLGLMALLIWWWIRATCLLTEVRPDGLWVRMAPFKGKLYPKPEVEGWRVHMSYPWGVARKGWAVKKSPGVTVYLSGAAAGIVVGLKGQKGLWLSSGQPEQLAKALSQAIPKER